MKDNRKPIGSHFSLEISKGSYFYHNEGLKLNTGRNALEYIFRAKDVKSVYIPYFTCNVLFTPVRRLNIEMHFYHIGPDFFPDFDFSSLKETDYFLYINYFGVCDHNVEKLAGITKNLIVDNTQAFFCKAPDKVPTFYSARKFFGVADGAYLLNVDHVLSLEVDRSASRMGYLLSRMENEPEVSYSQYKYIESEIDNLPLRLMSPVTEQILSSVNYEAVRNLRENNFKAVHEGLSIYNKLTFQSLKSPLIYPLLIGNGVIIKKKLIEKRIFSPTFWTEVLQFPEITDDEKNFVTDIVPLPIDQRYNEEDMQYLVNTLKTLINEG